MLEQSTVVSPHRPGPLAGIDRIETKSLVINDMPKKNGVLAASGKAVLSSQKACRRFARIGGALLAWVVKSSSGSRGGVAFKFSKTSWAQKPRMLAC